MISFSPRFFLFAFVLFVIEVFIALFVHDSFVRPYVGDYLVVILMYCAVKSFIKAAPLKIAVGVLLFSFMIEVLQYFRIVDRLGLAGNKFAKTLIGYGFSWLDILAYTLGIITVLVMDLSDMRRNMVTR